LSKSTSSSLPTFVVSAEVNSLMMNYCAYFID
jgi:hypothetical protein